MFDWISDAIDWIGDGLSSIWDNTVGSTVDAITDEIRDIMFSWLFNLIYGAVADLFEFINASTSNIFSLSWVQSFILLFHSLAWMLFVCGLIVAAFDTAIAYESGQANIKNTCLNVLKGFMAASLVTVIPQRLYAFCVAMQGIFSYELLGGFIGAASSSVVYKENTIDSLTKGFRFQWCFHAIKLKPLLSSHSDNLSLSSSLLYSILFLVGVKPTFRCL